jgi:hypothetical protein
MSRSHQFRILTLSGGEIFSVEPHPELSEGARIKYRTGTDSLGIEILAVDVRPVETIAIVKDPKIALAKPEATSAKRTRSSWIT